jgi:DnaJ-class molecular chaperone
MTSMGADYYSILGLDRHATAGQIKSAYRRMVREHHPDANPATREEATLLVKEVIAAYATLSDPVKKARYDRDVLSPLVFGESSVQTASHDEGTTHFYIHPSAAVSFLGRVREANGFTSQEMAHRLGLSEDVLKQMESRDSVPLSPVQLRTLTHLTEVAIEKLESAGQNAAAAGLRHALARKKVLRQSYR